MAAIPQVREDDAVAREAVRPWLFGKGRIDHATREIEEKPGTDSFGNPGTTVLQRVSSEVRMEGTRDELVEGYLDAGFDPLPRDSHRADDHARLRLDRLDPSNPFLFEREVQAGIGGRQVTALQREVLEKKVASLRSELADGRANSRRKVMVTEMIRELETGLLARVSIDLTTRSFRPAPLFQDGARLGRLLPLSRLSQLVYHVRPQGVEEEDDSEPMYLTMLGVGEKKVAFLFSGGIAGQRTACDLDGGVAHHAWFRNRKVDETADTAPWISRNQFAELTLSGETQIIVRRGRDEEPIRMRAVGKEPVRVDYLGERVEVPTVVAETDADDRFWVLVDQESPLVLRLEEAGADLVRKITEVRALADL
jgi:hypothetical protein